MFYLKILGIKCPIDKIEGWELNVQDGQSYVLCNVSHKSGAELKQKVLCAAPRLRED